LGQVVQQGGRLAHRDARRSVDDEVLVEARAALPTGLPRDGHTGIALDVAEFVVVAEVTRHDVVAVEARPDDRDVRAAVGVDSDDVGQVAGGDGLARLGVEESHGALRGEMSETATRQAISVMRSTPWRSSSSEMRTRSSPYNVSETVSTARADTPR